MRQTYQNAYGKVLQDNLEKLLTSKLYQSMTDPVKSAAVTDLYDYAKAVAAEKTVGKEMTAGAKKAAEVISDGGELPDYLHFCAMAINGLDLTVNQKNVLYDANDWAKSTLYDAPWYDIMPRLSGGGGSYRWTSGRGTISGKTGTVLDKYRLGKYSLDKYDIMPKL